MIHDDISSKLGYIGINFPTEMVSSWASKELVTPEGLEYISSLLDAIYAKKKDDTGATLLRLSRIPTYNPSTFTNFNYTRFEPEAQRQLKSLSTLSFITQGRNVIITGSSGTGKTHLAMAIGNEACSQGIKSYFITFHDLNDRLTNARRDGSIGRVMKGLSKARCLIIDEVGKGKMDKENTDIFFHVVSMKTSAKTPGSIIMTSNMKPSEWNNCFSSDETAECCLDRLFNKADCIELIGSSYRGRERAAYHFKMVEPLTVTRN